MKRSRSSTTPAHVAARPQRRAFTLLELMLALSLTVIVLLIVNMAVDIHLRSLDTRRTQLEESQLARSILRMIADDLRAATLPFEQDMSSVEALLQQSAGSAAQSLAGAVPMGDGGSSGGQPQGSESSESAPREGAEGSSETGSSTTGLSGLTGALGSQLGVTEPVEPGTNTADLATTTIPAVPGLFGNQYQLQVDVSRLPRLEEYYQTLTPDAATTVMDVPSDVKTVTYYVQSIPAVAGVAATPAPLETMAEPTAQASGLIRRELDRSVTRWAMDSGNYTGLQNTGDVLAPEVVAIEFQYFDGIEWVLEWDTELQQKLPIAVLVTLAMRAPGSVEQVPVDVTSPDAGLHLYRTLVYLPAGGQEFAGAAGNAGLESSGTSEVSSGTAPGGTL